MAAPPTLLNASCCVANCRILLPPLASPADEAALGIAPTPTLLNAASSKALLDGAQPACPLTAEVTDIIASVTGLGLDALSPDLSLVELGIGSLQVGD